MITRFNDYNKLNEGVVSDLIKKLYKGLVDNIDEEIKTPLEEFTKKTTNVKDPKQMKNIVLDYLKSNYETLNKSLEEDKTTPDILSTINDNLKAIYTAITAVNDTIGSFKFEYIFSDEQSDTIKLFTRGAKKFKNDVEPFSKNLMLKLDKNLNNDELDIPTDEAQRNQINNTAPQGEEVIQPQAQPQTESDYTKLKEDIGRWFDSVIYKNIKDNLDFEKTKEDGQDNVSKNIEENKLQNKDGITKILSQISKIDDSAKMAKLRDTLIELGFGNIDEYGKF